MASIARSSMLRHAFTAAPIKQNPSRSASTVAATTFRTAKPLARQSFQSAFARSSIPSTPRVAAFHATGSKAILPPLPQAIRGDINDPAPVPESHPTHGNYHWSFERLVAASLIPLTMAPFIGGSLNPVTDAVFCAALIIHSHLGFQSCVIDYFPDWRVPKIRATFNWLLRAATLGVAVGLYEFETNDIGVTAAVARIWQA
ncbi:CybS-domain-containing protein [Tothia fuscella]|uniref:Succinate dehydrogenase [ubiquinone] cytochrome b small subunit n=1 Tax=Tothia fuscella TaxID=1048955 RepID=A0A9P4NQ65_9PEZI|nr:CybS-domain-containing protein [Tothia fuscella]